MRVPAPKPGDLTSAALRWRSAASAIVLRETAAAAWAHPDEIASYDAFDKLASARLECRENFCLSVRTNHAIAGWP
jgi:hypothetical protein